MLVAAVLVGAVAAVGILVPIAMFAVFGWVITVKIRLTHERKMKELELARGAEQRALGPGNTELDERVRHLESIVCSVDFELNAKLDRLASRQLAAIRVPPEPSSSALGLASTTPHHGVTLAPGKRLANRYVIERLLGRGGMGEVYLARDEQLGEEVALKLIGGLAALDPQAADRLRREASASRKVSHRHVVRLHDIGEADGVLFLSMEYVPGQSLRDLLARHGVLPPAQLRGFAAQIADGLQAAHAVGVVHRDLKPANLLVDAERNIKIIDFGLARVACLEGMTATNMIVGTVEYMAPEQIRGGTVDARTDVYALGAVLFHALVGRPPFLGDNPIAVGFAHCSQAIPAPSTLRPDLGDAWDHVVARALAKDPADRWQSAEELRDALPAG